MQRPVTVARAFWSAADRDWLRVPPVSERLANRFLLQDAT